MEILAIRGKNLASLEGEFNIDFAAEPLRSAGIYAITGPTGAGKSTILDALCLALFDDAPRVNKAGENIQISDVADKTINQKDSRNILRKGTSDGYAEVEFVALNGEKYRSTWFVRRSRGKADGALQNTEIRLFNVSKALEEQGTKKDILSKITELIGLNFEQFTRAVLLAQGDFSTFLKAKQSEKAELLEKLTGTEIYSKISATIFKKTKEAEQLLKNIAEKINDVKLLSEEEIEAVFLKKDSALNELNPINTILAGIEKKLNWIKQYEEIQKEIVEAENNLETIRKAIHEAKPRYEYILKIDASMEVRDNYILLENKQQQHNNNNKKLLEQETLLKSGLLNLAEIDENLSKTKLILSETQQKYKDIKPQIDKAKELDIKIQSINQNISEIKKDMEIQNGLKTKSEQSIQEFGKRIGELKLLAEKASVWLREKAQFSSIIEQSGLIINMLNDAKYFYKQHKSTQQNKETNSAILSEHAKELEKLIEEEEKLNKILPSEILALREKLEEGKPCPVCGNIHHHLKTTNTQDLNINEEQLKKSKQKVAELISALKLKIEDTKANVNKLDALEKGFKTQYDTAVEKLEKLLQQIANWKEWLPKEDVLQKRLTELTNQWKQYSSDIDENVKQQSQHNIKLEQEHKNLHTSTVEYERKKLLLEENQQTSKAFSNERETLLNGKKAEEVETFFNDKLLEQTNIFDKLNNQKTEIENKNAKCNGAISQLKDEIKRNLLQIACEQEKIDKWLLENNQNITKELLQELVSKPAAWVSAQKKEFAELKEKETTTNTTCSERRLRLQKHNKIEDKPAEIESATHLETLLKETKFKETTLKEQLTEIEFTIRKYNENKEIVLSLKKELEGKNLNCENWRKLNSLLGSADGSKFKTIAQGYTLDVLLGYANKHLEDLTQRYKLEKIPETLALQVVDNDMLGEIRTIHSLSGGESFLISLSLALGLSSLSSNRMKIESLFIDEGFGSLDADTLNIAIDALENLHTQGRKIGIISHVGEMRISTQIQIVKTSNGKSFVKIASV